MSPAIHPQPPKFQFMPSGSSPATTKKSLRESSGLTSSFCTHGEALPLRFLQADKVPPLTAFPYMWEIFHYLSVWPLFSNSIPLLNWEARLGCMAAGIALLVLMKKITCLDPLAMFYLMEYRTGTMAFATSQCKSTSCPTRTSKH